MTVAVPKAVRSWVADAEAVHGAALDEWFPSAFAWRAFCADAPAIAERLGASWPAGTAAAARARLEELAQAAFRGAYVGALALLAAYDAQAQPDDALVRLTSPLSDAEADALEPSLAEDLAAIERGLEGEDGVAPSPRAAAALPGVRLVREPVRALLADGLQSAARAVLSLGGTPGPIARVAAGVVNVAVALAVLRHAASAQADDAEGRDGLLLDREAMRRSLGGPADDDAADDDAGAGDDDPSGLEAR